MNRVRLRLYSPPTESQSVENETEFADIIPFESARRSVIFSGRFPEPAQRARLIRENNSCPSCDHHNIEPLELEDALISPRSRLPIPGTATIVGFHCHDCGTEWPVYEINRRQC